MFLTQKYIKIIFFLFLILTHQNDFKTLKNINLNKKIKNLKIEGTQFAPRSQTLSKFMFKSLVALFFKVFF
jgi:hypothetical protein